MKKQILELLIELEELNFSKHNYFVELHICSDFSGVVLANYDNELFSFDSEKQLIQGLKDKIKELKNK